MLAGVFALAMSGAAQAACAVPAISDSDTVMKFGTSTSSESRGVMGTKGPLNARTAGTVYYDHAAGQLKLCNGRDWVNVIGELAVQEPANALRVGRFWKRVLRGSDPGPYGPVIVPHGMYKIRVDFARTNARCSIYFGRTGGARVAGARHDDSENSVGGGQVSWFASGGGQNGDVFRFMVESIYGPDRSAGNHEWNKHRIWMYAAGDNMGAWSDWQDDGNYLFRWDGKFTISVDSCTARVTVMRIK